MRLTFLGTRGEIEARSKRHHMHSSLLAADGDRKVMIDCGSDWCKRVHALSPDAIVLTHAHSDHAAGLKSGSPCEVFARAETWRVLKDYRISDRKLISPHKPFLIGEFEFEAFLVAHSVRAPAVGFQVSHGGGRVFYAPDVVSILEQDRALAHVDVYIGDGATIVRPIIRRRGNTLIGHASIATQMSWCRQEGVRRAIFTHCGSQIVAGDEATALARVRELGRQSGIEATLAHDGLVVVI